jgi:outer membrane protein assembly factor BamB
MKPKRRIIIFILLIVLAGTLSACAGRGTAASSWPGLFTTGETVFVAYNTQVYAIQSANGTQNWKFPVEPNNQTTFYADPVMTPDGQLIVGSYDHILYSLNPENGSINWQFTEAKNRFIAAPLATNRGIFAPNADKNIYALSTDNTKLWTYTLEGESWAQPVSDPECQCLYVTSMDHTVYALDPGNGNLLWRTADLGGAIVGTPALSSGDTLYVGTFGSEMLALNSQNGQVLWRFPTDGWIWSGPALNDGRLYFGDLNGNFYAVDAENGKQVWKIGFDQLDGPISGSPLIFENTVYFTTESGSLYLSDLDGKIRPPVTIGGKMYSAPLNSGGTILVTPIDTDNLLVALSPQGSQIWAFNPNPQ